MSLNPKHNHRAKKLIKIRKCSLHHDRFQLTRAEPSRMDPQVP